jgi:Flp pilus assembly protein TadG
MVGEAPTEGVSQKPFVGRLPRPRVRPHAFRRDQRGTAVVEFALVAPILFLLVFGILDFGRALNYYNQLTQLAGQGARAAAVSNNPDGSAATGTSIQKMLATQYANGGLQNGIKVCISNGTTGSGTAGNEPTPGQAVQVQTTYKFNFLPLIGAAVGGGSITLTATQSERQELQATYSLGCYP